MHDNSNEYSQVIKWSTCLNGLINHAIKMKNYYSWSMFAWYSKPIKAIKYKKFNFFSHDLFNFISYFYIRQLIFIGIEYHVSMWSLESSPHNRLKEAAKKITYVFMIHE